MVRDDTTTHEYAISVTRRGRLSSALSLHAVCRIRFAGGFVMVPRLAGFVVALTVVVAGAQASAQTPQPPPDTQTPPAISLPPALDRVLRDYEAAWRDGDGPRLAALFTEDGFAVQSGSPMCAAGPRLPAASRNQAGRCN